MDSAAIKLEQMQQIMSIVDDKTLLKVVNFFKKEVVADEDEGHISDEEYAQFQEELAKRDRGEIRFYSEEESIRMVREGFRE